MNKNLYSHLIANKILERITDEDLEEISDRVIEIAKLGKLEYVQLVLNTIDGDKKELTKLHAGLSVDDKFDYSKVRFLSNLELFDEQQAVFKSIAREIVIQSGRRAGKTVFLRKKIFDTLCQKDKKILYIAKTKTTAESQVIYPLLQDIIKFSVPVKQKDTTSGEIYIDNGSYVHWCGNSSVQEREKLRGNFWDLVIIDECQSQGALKYLLEDVIEPSLIDRRGMIILSGTGPLVRGCAWEEIILKDESLNHRKFSWNITNNPTISDCEVVLKEVLEKHGWSENDPTYIREWLGQIAYDDDALVINLKDSNFYEDKEFDEWMKSQRPADVYFTSGLDYGFADYDGYLTIAHSRVRSERYVIYQYKNHFEGQEELATAILNGKNYVEEIIKKYRIPNKFGEIYADHNEGRTTKDFVNEYNLPIFRAKKTDKINAIRKLKDEFACGKWKIKKNTPLHDELDKTIWKRDSDSGNLLQKLDDCYHADIFMALLYASRRIES